MRLRVMILLACLAPAAQGYGAEDTGDRTYPSDNRSACMDRDMDSARGGCVTREDGSAWSAQPKALPPEPDTTRQSPPESTASERAELPQTGSER